MPETLWALCNALGGLAVPGSVLNTFVLIAACSKAYFAGLSHVPLKDRAYKDKLIGLEGNEYLARNCTPSWYKAA